MTYLLFLSLRYLVSLVHIFKHYDELNLLSTIAFEVHAETLLEDLEVLLIGKFCRF